MAKIYFCVGHLGSGHRGAAGHLVEMLRTEYDNDKIFSQDFGKDSSIADYGTTPSGAILFEISNMLAYHDTVEAFVFTGWQLLENIEAIYEQYRDTATFVFVKAGNERAIWQYARGNLRTLSSSTILTNAIDGQTSMSNFFTNNNLSESWNYVDFPIFNSDKTIQTVATTSSQMVTLIGTL